jgi:hypothetical protein
MFSYGFTKVALQKEEPSGLRKSVAPLAAGAATYAVMRRGKALPRNAPAKFKQLREATQRHGLTRVHLHEGNKPPGAVKKFVTEVLHPADTHAHLSTSRAHIVGTKTKAPVFDPDSTGRFKSPIMIGKSDRTAKAIDRSKLKEYQIAKKMGLHLPKTSKLRSIDSLKKHEIAKLRTGSQSKVVITHEDVKAYNPRDPNLKAYRAFKSLTEKLYQSGKVSQGIRDFKLTRHPGYKSWMVEQALKHPKKFIKQDRIHIDKEYRVHTLFGKSLGISSPRHGLEFGSSGEAERAAEKILKDVHPKLKDNLLALDIARDKKGKWHIIETNPGPESGFITPSKMIDFRGPHAFYKAMTGRHAPSSSLLAAGGATAATAAAQEMLTSHKPEKKKAYWRLGEGGKPGKGSKLHGNAFLNKFLSTVKGKKIKGPYDED